MRHRGTRRTGVDGTRGGDDIGASETLSLLCLSPKGFLECKLQFHHSSSRFLGSETGMEKAEFFPNGLLDITVVPKTSALG